MGRLANKVSIITSAASTNGLYQDGPGVDEYSRHCQVFAILTDTIDKEQGACLLSTVLDDESYTNALQLCRFIFSER